jgi:DGQHR domain-containing protein
MNRSVAVLEVQQPIGVFYLGVIDATTLLRIGFVRQRGAEGPARDAIQRVDSTRRVKEIAQYLDDPDATFPTPIILSCSSQDVPYADGYLSFDDEKRIGEIVDGQHRFLGMERAAPDRLVGFQLPVVFMLDLEAYEKAYVFSTINSKQTPVPKSLIYDLFALAEHRSPTKTSHEIARVLNTKPESPFYRGLKMLGSRTSESEFLTQGSFVKEVLRRISRNPQLDEIQIKRVEALKDEDALPLRYYFVKERDEVIVQILENYFSAVRSTFAVEWEPPTAKDYILRKTVGFQALMSAFDTVWKKARKEEDASFKFFLKEAEQMKERLGGRALTSVEFPSSGSTASKLAKVLLGVEESVGAAPAGKQ